MTEDENEIEQVFGQYVMETLLDEIGELSEEEATLSLIHICRTQFFRFVFCWRNDSDQPS